MVIQFTYEKQWIEASIQDQDQSITIKDVESSNSLIVHLESSPFRDQCDRAECLRAFAIGIWLTHPHLSKVES